MKMSHHFRKLINHFNHFLFDGRIAKLHYPPKWVTIGIAGHCTFKCLFCCCHCPDAGKKEKIAHQYKIPYTLDFETYKRIVQMCVEAKVPHIHLCSMGEPFLHPQLMDFVDYLTSFYPRDISLQTDFAKNIFEKKRFVEKIIERRKHIRTITTDIFGEQDHNRVKSGSDFNFVLDCMEHLSRETTIKFNLFMILTKNSYKGVPELLEKLHRRRIKFKLHLTNLFPFGFNEFTSANNIYLSTDENISNELKKIREKAKKLNAKIRITPAWDTLKGNARCLALWNKVQLLPTKKLPKSMWPGNAVPFQCPAVVIGDMFTIGNLLEFDDFMSFWNNDRLVSYRKMMLNGQMPDDECENCCYG